MTMAMKAALMLVLLASTPSEGETWGDHKGKLSGVIIPGFASTQLRAWAMLDCPFSPLDFHPLDSVWLDTRKVISVVNCWLKCMMLDPYNQTDNPECKSRPDTGLSAITELDPGYITGPLSSVWREWVKWCVEFGIDANAILAVPYDWRLSASMLEERDLYFHKLKAPYWQSMIDAVAICGPGFKAPTEGELSGYLLDDMVEDMRVDLEEIRKEWIAKGCTIMTDGWTDRRNRTLLNFLVSCGVQVPYLYGYRLYIENFVQEWLFLGIMTYAGNLMPQLTFETALKLRGGPSLVFAHSMGNNVFHYFLEWLKLEIAPKLYNQWLDDHIYAYFAVGAPFLGAVETIKATLSGVTFGLPVPEGTSRLMCNSFGSSLWMLPFSEHCRRDHIYWKSFFDGIKREGYNVNCDEKEYISNFSGWPVDLVNIEIPVSPGADAVYPGISKEAEAVSSAFECGIPLQQSFSAREVADGTLFNEIGDIDPNSKTVLHQLHKFYHNDPVLNALTPWDRPPIKNIFCIYGIDLKTEVGYHFAPSGKPYPDNWIVTDIIYEIEGGTLQSRSGNPVHGNPTKASGDTTVPYHSLSWCKTWLGSHVNITRTPQSEHDGSDVQEAFNIERQHGRDFIPNMTRDSRLKYITYYEDGESIPGKRTAVWELDKVNHRNLVQSPVIMRELWLEMWHSFHPDAKTKFVTKAKRGPLRDEECYWDYAKARCALPDHCEYRYVFGDVHLGQSCRLKASPVDLLHHYL